MPTPLSEPFGALADERVEGWYADPEHPELQRWWNGTEWTERRQLPTAPLLIPPAAPAVDIPASFEATETLSTPAHDTGEIAALVLGEPVQTVEVRSANRRTIVVASVATAAALGVVAYLLTLAL